MKLDWIIERLKVSGSGTKQEVLKALENASADDLVELGASCLMKVISPIVNNIVSTFNSDEIKEKIKEYMELLHSEHNDETN